MTRVVLIGSTGFIGRAIAVALDERKYSVVRTTRYPESNVGSVYANVLEPETILSVVERGAIVINAAGYADSTDRSREGCTRHTSVNVHGVQNIADACNEKECSQLIHVSSVAAMGRWSGKSITEDMMKPADSPYARSKRLGEVVLESGNYGLPITILRPTSVFGESRGLAHTLCRLSSLKVLPLPDGGTACIPFTYVANVAHAVELCIENPNAFNRTFIVGDRVSYPLRDIVAALAQELGNKPWILPIPSASAWVGARILELASELRGAPPVFDRGRLRTITQSASYSIDALAEAVGYDPPILMPEAARRIARAHAMLNN